VILGVRGIVVLSTGAALAAGCIGTTGGELVEFDAYAAGPADAVEGESRRFETGRGYQVEVTRATLHIGALYLNKSRPTSVASDTSCTLAGIYVAEVPGGLDVDVLSPALQKFPVRGFATTERAPTAEVWLTGGDINAQSDSTVIAAVAGTAEKDGATYPFEGSITISENRLVTPSDPAQPGAKPICKERVVTPILVDITPSAGGRLVVRVDPAGWFQNVDFERLEESGGVYRFRDDSEDQPSDNLYSGIRAASGVYDFAWEDDPNATPIDDE
jgi:hypothetical protein